ncbi:hypothetical protein E2F46_10690 [Luteimonas aestuarii]|uniref:Uncharacterized protein n=1 Tax=Luteimonas aestuarii TaxID=453837 RepID=A0A4R5TLC8_9GAMM|nr:hypothetical protein [Luteimonas aestuarii]TDK23380.1 hypothetical protein E2F46_10690 [Luteimonas aestuarii]
MQVDELDSLRFRNRRGQLKAHDAGTPFWRIVWAVFTALCLFGLLQIAIGIVAYRAVMAGIERSTAEWRRELAALIEPHPVRLATSPDPTSAPRAAYLPAIPGPIEARRRGDDTACIGGRISQRLPDGWTQSSTRCRASTQ